MDFLDQSINEVVKYKRGVFCDLFAGTGVVGDHFKKQNYSIIANDIQYYSYVINQNKINNHKPLKFKNLKLSSANQKNTQEDVFHYLNNLPGKEGFIYKNYSPGGTNNRRLYFSNSNSKKCDAIRLQIEYWKNEQLINKKEYYFLLCSLLESIDKFANTASIYGAFLKKIKTSAAKNFELSPSQFSLNDKDHKVYNQDANQLVKNIKSDIVYLDPPYNHRQYSANYHILETIALYDQPKLKGKTGMRVQEHKSVYCSRPKVCQAFHDLIQQINAKYIFLSYNDEGLMSFDDIRNIMSQRGKYGYFSQVHRRYKADNGRFNKTDKTKEYLHYVICDKRKNKNIRPYTNRPLQTRLF